MSSIRTISRSRVIVLACVALFPSFLHADTTTWTNSTNNNSWEDPGNWDPAPPGTSDSVVLAPFTGASTYIDLNGDTQTINDLTYQPGSFNGYLIDDGVLSLTHITNNSTYSTPQYISADLTTPTGTLTTDLHEDSSLTVTGIVTADLFTAVNYGSTNQTNANLILSNPNNSINTIIAGSDHYFGASLTATTPGAFGNATLFGIGNSNFTFTGVDPGATSYYPNSIYVSSADNIRVAANDANPNAIIALNNLVFPNADSYAYFESNSNTQLAFSSTTINGFTSLETFTFDYGTRAFIDLGSVSESSPQSSLSIFGGGTATVSGSSTYTGDTYISGGLLIASQPDSFGTNPASTIHAQTNGIVKFLSPQSPFHRVNVDAYGGIGGDLTGALFSGPSQNVFFSDGSIFLASSTVLPVRGVDIDHPAFLLGLESSDLSATTGEDPAQTSIFRGVALGPYTPAVPYGGYTGTITSYSGTDPLEVYLNSGLWVLTNVSFNTSDTATGVHFEGIGEGRIGAAHGSATVFTATGDPLNDSSNNYVMSLGDHATLAPGESVHISNGDLFTGYQDSVSNNANVYIHNTGTYVIGAFNTIPDGSPTTGTFNIDAGGAVYLAENYNGPSPTVPNLTSGATFNFSPGSLLILESNDSTIDNSAPNAIPTTADIILQTHSTSISFSDPIVLGDSRRLTTPADGYSIIFAPSLTAAPGATSVRLSAAVNQFLSLFATTDLPGVDLLLGDDDASANSFTTIQNFTQRDLVPQTGFVDLVNDITTRDLTVLSGDFFVGLAGNLPVLSVRNFNHNSTGSSHLDASVINLSGNITQTDGYVFLDAPVNYAHNSSITITGGYINFAATTASTLTDTHPQLTIGPDAIAYLDGPADPFSDSAGRTFNIHNDGVFNVYAGDTKLAAITGAGSTVLFGSSITADSITQSSLDIQSGSIILRPSASLSTLDSILITAGSFDLANNTLTITSVSPDTLRQYLHDSLLFSSASDSTHTLAYSFSAGPQARVLLSLIGDANLDGKINADDYALLDRSFAKHLADPHWTDGDFNYDGIINSQDYLLLDHAFLLSQAPGFSPGSLLSLRESEFGQTYVSELLSTLPEPSLLAACGLAIPFFSRRRA
ncbi:MAG TPA: dockerin type I domain-containing protein [Tepidisphaeraceae bacterium]|jgi:autotransporter-associated beta strand protein|nr:dockerin type I domain-containing protein [Tepidisphaeraceae bacterium]